MKPGRPTFQSISTVDDERGHEPASDAVIDAIANKRNMPTMRKPADEQAKQSKSQFRRTSISLFPIDEMSIDAIADSIKQRRNVRNIPHSMIIRVALRAITQNQDEIAETYDEIRAEDKRRK